MSSSFSQGRSVSSSFARAVDCCKKKKKNMMMMMMMFEDNKKKISDFFI